jgi:hypothetical protein
LSLNQIKKSLNRIKKSPGVSAFFFGRTGVWATLDQKKPVEAAGLVAAGIRQFRIATANLLQSKTLS